MLTRALTVARYDFARGRVIPDRLTTHQHAHYASLAERMLEIYASGIGQTRRDLHRRVRALFVNEADCPQRRIDAFCKLLDDASTFRRDTEGRAAALRRQVFRMAAASHPLVATPDHGHESTEHRVKSEIAARLNTTWAEIERELFTDVTELQPLEAFAGYAEGPALLARYNVAQVQAVLYDAVSMAIWAGADFKTILRYARLARLMHTITRVPDGRYLLRLDGPVSVLRATRRYGVQMARFLPALIACKDWRMHAVLRPRRRGQMLGLDLSSADGLHSHLPPPDLFDSRVEEAFAREWGEHPREGWSLFREGEILHRRQKVFVPDFVFRHEDGRRVLMEIVGFWTPEYLEAKLRTLEVFRPQKILVAIAETLCTAVAPEGSGTITYKKTLPAEKVLRTIRHLAPPLEWPRA